jgi:S-DNA-T family DNA segregation ATPase FtsK/SpoIIIE
MIYRKQEVTGILLCVLALCIFLSFITYNPLETPAGLSPEIAQTNIMGLFGIYTSYYLMKFSFGWGTFFLPIIMGLVGFNLFSRRDWEQTWRYSIFLAGLGIWVALLFAWIGQYKGGMWQAEYPGLIGFVLWKFFIDIFGTFASGLIHIVIFILLLSGLFNFSIYSTITNLIQNIKDKWGLWQDKKSMGTIIIREEETAVPLTPKIPDKEDDQKHNSNDTMLKEDATFSGIDNSEDQQLVPDAKDNIQLEDPSDQGEIYENIAIEDETEIEEGDLDGEKERQTRYRQYKLPVLDYLHNPTEIKSSHSEEELKEKANQLIHALETYGVAGRVVRISPGPVITLFEIEPAEGVRVNKFTNLSDDLARVMKAQRVRIIAPIPGSKSVGIELPNNNPSTVFLKNIINSEQFIQSISKLSIGLGKTTTGDAYVFDLGNMPHILVAGATGAGKSVCINTMIISIIYKAKPDEVKFILIDPKKIELSTYKSLEGYHLITAPNLDEYVMTTPENAVGILDSAIVEMERRFQVFADARVRNISEYHDRRKEDSELENIPFVVVIIDELADLMLTSGRAIEEPITRLAQKARAVGIHLIVATQRPSVDVITGVIKSNFPARIAFQVASKIDSRTIIDQMGAEKLLGRGDMLFLLPGTASPIRLHNAFVTLDEIEGVMEHILSQPKPDEVLLPETRKEKLDGEFKLDEDQDDLLKDAAVLVIQNQQASVSLLQRKFRIGYSRAGRLVDELESLGIISGYSGSKAREVLVDESYLDTIFSD